MPSPTKAHQRYRNKGGIIVPGVTTVIGMLAKPFLVPWAYKLGMAGEDMNKVRDLAADIGTCTHYLVECYLISQEPELDHFTPYVLGEAKKLFKPFKKWHGRQSMKTLGSELQLVSEKWNYGGTIDWMFEDEDGTTLSDFKTSTGIYDEARIQMAAYWHMWDEAHPDQPIQKVVIIHLDKRTYSMTPHTYTNLDVEWEMFKHLRALYVLNKQARAAAKAEAPPKKRGARLTSARRAKT